MKRIILPIILLSALAASADNQYDRDEIRPRHSFQDQLWLGTQAAFAGLWTCPSGNEICTGTVIGTTTTAALSAGDKVVLLASDSKYHSYEVAEVIDDDNWRRLRWVSSETEDPLLGVTASTLWEMNSGIPASTPADLYDGAGTVTPLALSAQEVQIGHNGLDGKLDLYADQATDRMCTIVPNAAMTSDATFAMPADEAAAESWLTMGTDGVIDYTAISGETLQAVTDRGATTTNLVTISRDGNNAATELLQLTNSNEATTGQTGDTAAISFDLFGMATLPTYAAHEAVRFEVYKESDWVNTAGGTSENDFDSGLKIYFTRDGTLTERVTFTSNGSMTATGSITGSGLSSSSASSQVPMAAMIGWSSTTAQSGTADLKLSRYEGLDTQERVEFDNAAGTISDGIGTGGIIVGPGTATIPAVILGAQATPTGLRSPAAGILDVNLNGTNTVGAGASVTESYDGALQEFTWAATIDHTKLTDGDGSQDWTVATLPAKTMLKRARLILITQFSASADTLTMTLGSSVGGAELLVTTGDLEAAAANTVYGDAQDGSETGTDLDTDITGAVLPPKMYSYTATQAISLRAVAGGGVLLSDYTAGEVRLVIDYYISP